MEDLLHKHLARIREAALRAADPAEGVRRALRWEADPAATSGVHLAGTADDHPALNRDRGPEKATGVGPAGTADDHPARRGERHALWAGPQRWELSEDNRLLLAAVGKAAVTMAAAAAEILGERLSGGVVVTKHGHAAGHRLPATLQVYEAGHPTPDIHGLQAAGEVQRLLEGAAASDRVLALISGGASALLPLPPPGVTLEELGALTGMLLRSGATIVELNTVRKHLDLLKGGGMARLASPAPLAALALSDVVGDPLDAIASGPTVPDPTTFADAWAILERYGLAEAAPPAIRERLQAGVRGEIPETLKPGDPLFENVTTTLIGSNRLAALAAKEAAEGLGYRSLILSTFVEGEAREIGKLAAALARGVARHGDPFPAPVCLVMGGETTVTVRGGGRGGRNQELALSAAIALDGLPGAAVMALATDGTDGPTDSGGAVVDGTTIARARSLGLDPQAALANNDAYPFLEQTGSQLKIGPTGTNVNDLIVIVVMDAQVQPGHP